MKLSKPSINPDDLNSFRPISNLTFLSKIRCIERIATKKLTVHADQQSIVSMIGHYNFHDVMWCVMWRLTVSARDGQAFHKRALTANGTK